MGRTFGSRLADVPACVEHAGPAALRAVLVAACLVLALTGQAQAAPGDLDTSFSDDGKQTTGFGGLTYTSAMALGTDGKIVVAGSVDQGAATGYDFALARYNVDGTLDSSFAGDGKQTFDFGGDDGVSAVVVQDDGKILVAGRLSGFELARLNVDGTLDSSFSGDGMQTTGFGGAGGLAIQDDGKIVVAGSTDESGFFSADFAVARYNLDGTLDSSFAGDGMQTTDFPQSGAGASAVAIQDDGKIVLAGGSQQPGPEGGAMVLYESAAARYNADGTLDSSFAGDGTLTTNSSDEFNAVAVQDDGKILFADGGGVARYNTDGTLDTSFAGLGGGSDQRRGAPIRPTDRQCRDGD